MATFAIGDVQGCHATLVRLLARCGFTAATDRVWFVGDLVNRGPASLEVLRRVRDLGDRATAVLGNHDVKLLALAEGVATRGRLDTLDPVLEAPDREDLVAWLAARPLLHREGDRVLVHAGVLPGWTVEEAEERAREAEAVLRGPRRVELLAAARSRGGAPLPRGLERAALTLRVLTTLRLVDGRGDPVFDFKGPPSEAPAGCVPWFDAPGRRSAGARFVCGHWSALGLHVAPGIAALDTGCTWGRTLTALRVDDGALFSEPAVDRPLPQASTRPA